MTYRYGRPTRAESRTAALLRVDAVTATVDDLQNPPLGFRIAVSTARLTGASWADIAKLTPYSATELEEMID